ncbi:MAG: Vps62-related protein [Anaerolineae bacterium]|nr:Vps62-related protein [Anaerolineae bacterium]
MAVPFSILTNDQYLRVGDTLLSYYGQCKLMLNGDGTLTMIKKVSSLSQMTVWSSGTTAPGGQFFAIMQSDGNFCVYKGTGPQDNQGWVWGTQATIPGGGQCFAVVEEDGSFCIYKGTGPNDVQGLVWSTQTAGLALIQKFAPLVYLHPSDKSRPDSVENYFKTVVLKGPDGNVVAQKPNAPPPTPVTADVLQAYNDPNNYLEFSNGQYPTATNNFETGATVVAAMFNGQPQLGVGTVAAPVYVRSLRKSDCIDIQYIFFYPCQTFETVRIGVRSGLTTKTRTFEWSPFGRHGADWEHITVRVDPNGQRILGTYYSQHQDSAWVHQPPLVKGTTHPVVWASLNSHAVYNSSGTFETDNTLSPTKALLLGLSQVVPGGNIPLLMDIAWAKTVDTTEATSDLVTYDTSARPFSQVQWAPYEDPNQLVILDKNPAASKWLNFQGCWGPPRLDNTHMDHPPALPDDVQNALFDFANTAYVQGKLKDDQKFGYGPTSPQQQNWWSSKEP